jgi:hypothetical protein
MLWVLAWTSRVLDLKINLCQRLKIFAAFSVYVHESYDSVQYEFCNVEHFAERSFRIAWRHWFYFRQQFFKLTAKKFVLRHIYDTSVCIIYSVVKLLFWDAVSC